MSKKNKKKNKKRKKQKQAQKIQEPVKKGISRRNLLKLAGGTAVIAAVYFGYNHFSYDEWAFVERTKEDTHAPAYDTETVEKNFIPFGKNTTKSFYNLGDEKAIEKAKRKLNLELMAKGHPSIYKAPYNLTLFTSHYGVNSKPKFANSTIDYCKKAIVFLHEKLPNLDKHNFKFVILKPGKNYTKNFNNTIFVGDSYYQIQEIKAINKNNPEQEASIKRTYSSNGAFCDITPDDKTNSVRDVYIFIPAYDLALLSIFSEIIPLTTFKASRQCYGKENELESMMADESISEGLSRALAVELAQKLNIPDGIKHLDDILLESYKPKIYKHVPDAIRWIKRNGIQKAFDIYIENPAKFMKLIKSN